MTKPSQSLAQIAHPPPLLLPPKSTLSIHLHTLLSKHLSLSLFLRSMARSLSQTLTLTRRHLTPKTTSYSSRLIALRAQSSLPFHHDQTDPSAADVDPLLRKLEDAIHRIIVRKSAPDWLPFVPGASYYVPPPRSRSHGLAQIVEKLANPLTEEESMSMTTVRGWPSSAYFIQGSTPLMDTFVPKSSNVGDNSEQRLDHTSDTALKTEEDEG